MWHVVFQWCNDAILFIRLSCVIYAKLTDTATLRYNRKSITVCTTAHERFPMTTEKLLQTLATRFPEKRLLQKAAQLTPYESDALTAFRSRPAAVVLAESQEEVIEAVRLCHQYNVPFVARGSGTSLSGGSLPIQNGIVIALNRLNRILRLDPQARIAVVEPGRGWSTWMSPKRQRRMVSTTPLIHRANSSVRLAAMSPSIPAAPTV
jgi:hypothetical protein